MVQVIIVEMKDWKAAAAPLVPDLPQLQERTAPDHELRQEGHGKAKADPDLLTFGR